MNALDLNIQDILLLCVLVETIVQMVKPLSSQKLTEQGIMVVSMITGIILAVCLDIGILTSDSAYIVIIGQVLTGAMASRGASFVHGFIDALGSISSKAK